MFLNEAYFLENIPNHFLDKEVHLSVTGTANKPRL